MLAWIPVILIGDFLIGYGIVISTSSYSLIKRQLKSRRFKG